MEQKAVEYLKGLDISQETIDEAINIIRERQRAELARRQPELDQLAASIRQCETEKADLLNTLIASRNQLTSALLDALNEKVEKVSDELKPLSEDAFYTEAIEALRKLRRVSDDLLTANDPFALRQVLLAGIERIQLTADGDFQIYGSSSNCNEWYPGQESNL